MKRNLSVAILLSLALFSCRPKVIYVDRPAPAATNPNNYSPAPTAVPADNQPYQAPAPANSTQINNTTISPNDMQQYNGNTQANNDQYNTQESEQQYNANQQQVNYGAPSYQTFYDELSPYGSWVNYQGYGYAWVPAQGAGFTPYSTNGYWTYSQYGWTWVSNYSWGWAPFHYGRWTMDPGYGWVWIPGNNWAPAWVTWGHCNGYYGWAPIGPGVTNYEGYRPPVHYWNFVPENRIAERNVNTYVVNHDYNGGYANTVTYVGHDGSYNNTNYNAGPPRETVEGHVGHKIETVNVAESTKPLPGGKLFNGNTLNVYRPAISQATAAHATPVRVIPAENVRTVNASAVHGVLPHANGTAPVNHRPENSPVNPAVRPSNQIQERPTEPAHAVQPERPQSRPVEERPQARPVEERPQSRPVEERPQARPVEERPQSRPVEARPQSRPVEERPQARPVEERPQARPVEERPQSRPAPETPQSRPAQQPVRNPNPNPNQNRPAPKPKPQAQPKPAPHPPVERERK